MAETTKMTPDQQLEFFNGCLAEAGLVKGVHFDDTYWCEDDDDDERGVTIVSWKNEAGPLVGRAFNLLAMVRGDPIETRVCGDCWAAGEAEDDALSALCASRGHAR